MNTPVQDEVELARAVAALQTEPLPVNLLTAIRSYIMRSTVMLADVHDPVVPAPNSVATGTLLATPAGRPVVLTAAHALDRRYRVDMFVGIGDGNAIPDVNAGYLQHPVHDVAVMAVNELYAMALRPHCRDLADIADDRAGPEKAFFFVAGYPTALAGAPTAQNTNYSFALFVTDFVDLVRDAQGRIAIPWEPGTFGADADAFAHLGYRAGGRHELPHPQGMSGAAVWRVLPPTHGFWSPEGSARIVGVAVSYCEADGREFAEPSSAWMPWLGEALRTIDEELSSGAT